MAAWQRSAVVADAMWTKSILVVLGVVWLAAGMKGAAPESLAGMTYLESTVGFMRSNAAEGRQLRSDGTYRGLFRAGTYGRTSLIAPRDGTWSYRKITETTGELTFGPGDIRTLTFQRERSGSLRGQAPSAGVGIMGTFALTDPEMRSPMPNSSLRLTVTAGGTGTAGFVVTDEVNYVLVRAVGPGLAAFGVTAPLAAPRLVVHATTHVLWESTGGWTADDLSAGALRNAAGITGAFPLAAGSLDVATLLIVPAGAYTAVASSAVEGGSGEVLLEVYPLR